MWLSDPYEIEWLRARAGARLAAHPRPVATRRAHAWFRRPRLAWRVLVDETAAARLAQTLAERPGGREPA
jgi:hypothetical protein